MTTVRHRISLGLVLAALCADVGQGQPPTFPEWRFVESAPETTQFRTKLGDGVFDEASQALLTRSILPQLALPKNRITIDNVRRRLRDFACLDPGGEAGTVTAVQRMLEAARTYLVALARDGNADPVVRVNAMMLLGELQVRGRKPWPGAVEPLVAAVADESLPLGVRVAAINGLAVHVEADGNAAAAVRPAVLAILAKPRSPEDDAAADWLRSRAVLLLPAVAESASADTASALTRILEDVAAPIDLRARVADALGRTVRPDSRVDIAKVIRAIEAAARTAIASDKDRIDTERVSALLGGGTASSFGAMPGMGMESGMSMPPDAGYGMPPAGSRGMPPAAGGRPGGPRPARPPRGRGAAMSEESSAMLSSPEYGSPAMGMGVTAPPKSAVGELSARRTAWRLDSFGRALAGDGTTGGLATVAGADEDTARALGEKLRDAAQKIAADPADQTILDAFTQLVGDAAAVSSAGAAVSPAGATPAAADPFAGETSAAADPFVGATPAAAASPVGATPAAAASPAGATPAAADPFAE